jgi:hypothetical protein
MELYHNSLHLEGSVVGGSVAFWNGSVPLIYGSVSGSGACFQWLTTYQQKISFFNVFLLFTF